jgi:hypothetical protein
MTEESIAKTLAEIQATVPKLLRERAVIEVKKTPTMEFVYRKFIEDKMGTEEQRRQIQVLLDSGEFSKVIVKEDPKVTKKIDGIIIRGIKKAIKDGKLPKDATPYTKVLYEKIYNQSNQS